MLLYHYNTAPLDELASQFARGLDGGLTAEEIKSPFAYIKNLSFFFEPIPDNLPAILHNEHHFWKRGAVLYEHVVNIDQLPEEVPYRIVETRAKTELLFKKQKWELVPDNPKLKEIYVKELHDLEQKMGYTGIGLKKLKEVLAKLPYDITKDYQELYKCHKKHPEDKLLEKYAANVPHLMAYTAEHKIKPFEVNKRILK